MIFKHGNIFFYSQSKDGKNLFGNIFITIIIGIITTTLMIIIITIITFMMCTVIVTILFKIIL